MTSNIKREEATSLASHKSTVATEPITTNETQGLHMTLPYDHIEVAAEAAKTPEGTNKVPQLNDLEILWSSSVDNNVWRQDYLYHIHNVVANTMTTNNITRVELLNSFVLDRVINDNSSLKKVEHFNTFILENLIDIDSIDYRPDTSIQASKYVIPALNGTGKTNSLIAYCVYTLDPDPESEITLAHTGLIVTNTTDEAIRIADTIRNVAMNNRSTEDTPCVLTEANIEFDDLHNTIGRNKLIVTTHQLYKELYISDKHRWARLNADADLIVFDGMMDTFIETSVSDNEIKQVMTFFNNSDVKAIFNKYPRVWEYYLEEQAYLIEDLQNLDIFVGIANESGSALEVIDESQYPSFRGAKYKVFEAILNVELGSTVTQGSLQGFTNNLRYSEVLTGIYSQGHDIKIINALRNTINKLNMLLGGSKHTYITGYKGIKSYNMAEEMVLDKSIACFDATARLNKEYELRAKYRKDIFMLGDSGIYDDVRDYSNVTIHTATAKTDKGSINLKVATEVMMNAKLGAKTLIVTHEENQAFFHQAILNLEIESRVAITYWDEINGSNTWRGYDTCIIAGLNHKRPNYALDRLSINTMNGLIVYGEESAEQQEISNSVMSAEIIEAINRIRVRQVINEDGRGYESNIYLILPIEVVDMHMTNIRQQMKNIQFREWTIRPARNIRNKVLPLEAIVLYLQTNMREIPIPLEEVEKKFRVGKVHTNTLVIGYRKEVIPVTQEFRIAGIKIEESDTDNNMYYTW